MAARAQSCCSMPTRAVLLRRFEPRLCSLSRDLTAGLGHPGRGRCPRCDAVRRGGAPRWNDSNLVCGRRQLIGVSCLPVATASRR
eukprot:3772116-Prymnesium_polylepis.1